jgi:hypothetical protein
LDTDGGSAAPSPGCARLLDVGEVELVVVAGGLSLLATLTGLVVGHRLQSRGAHASWLRERRLQAYGDVLAAVRDLDSLCAEMYHPPRPGAREEAMVKVLDAGNRVGAALGMLDVLGPAEVTKAGRAVADASHELLRVVLDVDKQLPVDPKDRVPLSELSEGDEALKARSAFIVAASSVVT